MYHRKVMQALRLGLVVTLVVLAMSACGGGGGEEEASKTRPLPEDEKALRPGVYRSEEFKPPSSSESATAGQTHHRRPLTTCGSREERLGG
jgi:hypothetical protein